MKKLLTIVSVAFCIVLSINATKSIKSVKMTPPFLVTKSEIICCTAKKTTKKLHVVSSATMGSYYANTGLRITDMTTMSVIRTYNPTTEPITADFTTECLALIGGRAYKIEFLNSSSVALPAVILTIVAPKCGLEGATPGSTSTIDPNATPIKKKQLQKN